MPVELLPSLCFENFALKLECAIKSLSRNFNDIHAWNAIKLYGTNANRNWIGDVPEYLNRCEKLYGGKVKVFLKSMNKHLDDFSRPLPLTHFGVSSFEQKFSTNNNIKNFLFNSRQEICAKIFVLYKRSVVLPNFNSAKYAKQFNTTQDELLMVANDPILLDVISEMCEKMFNVQINCSFERYKKIPKGTERILVEFLFQTSIDVKYYLKYNAEQESVVLPTGYIENPYKHRAKSAGYTVYVDDSQCSEYSVTFSNACI